MATALLAMICIACMPLLRPASEAASLPIKRTVDRSVLAELADRVAQRPEAFGIDDATMGSLDLLWPADLAADRDGRQREVPAVLVEVVHPAPGEGVNENGEPPSDRWLVLRADGEVLVRWCMVGTRSEPTRSRRTVCGGARAGRDRLASNRRVGMTLIETLVALAITSALATAVFAWTTTAARVARAASERASRETTVAAILRGIQDDLLCRDADSGSRGVGRRPMTLDGGHLTIRTRAGSPDRRGPVTRRYRLDANDRTLSVEETVVDGGTTRATLARSVDRFEVALATKGDELVVTVAIDGGEPVTRRYVVP